MQFGLDIQEAVNLVNKYGIGLNEEQKAEGIGITLLKIREIITKAIEPLRSEKTIGSSLEVDVLIESDENNILEKYQNELADLFIVSHAYVSNKDDFDTISSFKQDNITIKIQKAKGEKCQRCWKYRELNSDGICEDCMSAIK